MKNTTSEHTILLIFSKIGDTEMKIISCIKIVSNKGYLLFNSSDYIHSYSLESTISFAKKAFVSNITD